MSWTRTFARFTFLALVIGLPSALGCSRWGSSSGTASAGPDKAPATAAPSAVHFIPYDQGTQQAHQAGKPMLVFFKAKWCKFCPEMENETFANAEVARLARQFVCVTVDADQGSAICDGFAIHGFPTVQFVSPDGVPLNRVVGRSTATELSAQMQAALKAASVRMAAARGNSAVR